MKKLITVLLLISSGGLFSQNRKAPKMAPVFSDGYYINTRGDTVKGGIQTNVEETAFYSKFMFKSPRSRKPKAFNTQRSNAYGFDGRHFIMVQFKGEKMFVERLTNGRLALFEHRFNGKVNGDPGVETAYYIKDTWADAGSQKLDKISNKFYKKSLKPYLKAEQPMIWDDLDKFNFDRNKMVTAIREFNSYYTKASN